MSKKNQDKSQDNIGGRPSILSSLFGKREKDSDYLPELKAQWGSMAGKERLLFVLGGLLGLIIFAGAILLIYVLITTLRGIGG